MLISRKVRRYFELAKKYAFKSTICHKHSSVLVKGGKIINVSYNKLVFSSLANRFRRQQKGIGTLHAEIGAVLNLDKSVTNNADLYVMRINNKGHYMLSAPCSMCIKTAQFMNIRRIIYTIDDNHVGIVKIVKS